jgi:hypothetical protein
MQIVFLMALGLLIITIATAGTTRQQGEDFGAASAAAAQMAVYHTAAAQMCQEVTCSSGLVDPSAYVNDQIRNGPLFGKRYFQTNYDAPTKTVVTYMKSGYALRGSVNFGTVLTALRDMEGGHSTNFGEWDKSAGRVVPSYISGYAVTYKPPVGISSVIPDRSPVMVGRI